MTDPTLLVARRSGRAEHTPHDEEVLIEGGAQVVVLHMEDGERIELDAIELRAALAVHAEAA